MSYLKLPGLKSKVYLKPGDFAQTPDEALSNMDRKRAGTAAGDTGAMNCWRDDKGFYRAAFSRHWVDLESIETKDRAELEAFVRNNWHLMGKDEQPCPS